MKAEINQEFVNQFRELPMDVRELVRTNFRRFLDNPHDSELHFRPLKGTPMYSMRIGNAYRAVGILIEDTIVWFWIGTHGGYIETSRGNALFSGA